MTVVSYAFFIYDFCIMWMLQLMIIHALFYKCSIFTETIVNDIDLSMGAVDNEEPKKGDAILGHACHVEAGTCEVGHNQ